MESQTDKRRLNAAQRQVAALKLRMTGASFQRIADTLGYKGESGAHKAVTTALRKTLQEPADELRKMEAERLDRMLEGLWEKAIGGDTWSVDRVLNIMERRAKLLGLDGSSSDAVGKLAETFLAGADTVRHMEVEDLSGG